MKRIPEETRIQQINALPNIIFVRWVGAHKNAHSKAVVRCAVDGFEWEASANSLISHGTGCPKCANNTPQGANAAIKQINAKSNVSFVRWVDGYKNRYSKAVCKCAIDGFEWSSAVNQLINRGSGCPQCSGKRRWTAEERIAQINARPNIEFIRWSTKFSGGKSRAVCKCAIDGFEWSSAVYAIVGQGAGCPQCAGNRRWTAEERIAQINAKPNIEFVCWENGYKNAHSKAMCRCTIDGFERSVAVDKLLSAGTGCPQCSPGGYNSNRSGTLYILRSECGSMVKIGISNNYNTRHAHLRRVTPFDWSCIELLHSTDGSLIAEFEKELHDWTEQAEFREPFDGYTEWRKWDDRLPRWIGRYRARLARIVAP